MKYLKYPVLLASVILVSACQSVSSDSSSKVEAPVAEVSQQEQAMKNDQLFEVHKDGRIYVFYDFNEYKAFLKTGHPSFVLTKIGAGPKGETMVYVLTDETKKKREGIPSVDLMEGRLPAAEDFYAEMNMEGRTYVFSRFEDMTAVRKLGEAPLRHAKIGYGANGESVIFVLHDGNKKEYPEALIKRFDEMNKK